MKPCSKCREAERAPGQRYCRACHAAYVRAWRRNRPISEEERLKSMTRARSRYLVKRDKMPPVPCLLCNAEPAQRHHPDYSNPRLVVWLCAPCHRALHQHWKLGT